MKQSTNPFPLSSRCGCGLDFYSHHSAPIPSRGENKWENKKLADVLQGFY